MIIGLDKDTVRLIHYTPEWKRLFEEEKRRLLAAVGSFILDIQHVGSTSIPGMAAKPILDIAIGVRNFEEARCCISPIEALGYEYKGEMGIPCRHFFVKGDPRTHHIHMNELGNQDWNNQIAFRDFLIRHPETARDYAQLKRELARRYPMDRPAYLSGKAPFIARVLQMAGGGVLN